MTSILIRWCCPFCDTSQCVLVEQGGENAAMVSLNTHLRKLSDETHGAYETFPTDWTEEDARNYVTVTEGGSRSPATQRFQNADH